MFVQMFLLLSLRVALAVENAPIRVHVANLHLRARVLTASRFKNVSGISYGADPEIEN